MARTVGEADAFECRHRLVAVGHAVVVLCDHDVLDRRQIGDHVELLEHDADLVTAEARQLLARSIRQHIAVEDDFTARRAVHAADDVHQRRLARAGGTHDREPLAFFNIQVDIVQGEHLFVVRLGDVLQFKQTHCFVLLSFAAQDDRGIYIGRNTYGQQRG